LRGVVQTPVHELPPQPGVSQPTSAPPSSPAAQPTGNGQQTQPPPTTTPTPNAGTPAAPQPNAPTLQPGAPPPPNPGSAKGDVVIKTLQKTDSIPPLAALRLTTKTNRPVVGKDVVVVAALEPSHAGASYLLNWGDGSAEETVSDSGRHRYAKAKMYKVSARTVVEGSQLNHELLLQVKPVVWPRVVGLMTMLAAGLAFGKTHLFVPKLTASARWGAPGVPEMTLLNREPYASLSFEPGVGPAEESITFSNK
jgi:hypothetical protein